MKIQKICIALLLLIIIGLTVFIRILIQQEERYNISNLQSKGSQLVSLIALHPLRDFEGDKKNFFLRILIENSANQGLVYCFINDQSGRSLVSLDYDSLAPTIPRDIIMKSLSASGLIKQTFEPKDLEYSVYEFSKPVFKNGLKTGTVRIGLKLPRITILSMEKISLLAILAFVAISAVIILYYGVISALSPLEELKKNITGENKDANPNSKKLLSDLSITAFVQDFQKSLGKYNNKLKNVETDNLELTSKLGVMSFEKNQIVNIINSIDFGIIITDIQENVGYINDYFLCLLNKTRQDTVDRPLAEVLKHDGIASFISQKETLGQSNLNHLNTTFPELVPGEIYKISFSYLLDGEKAPIGKMIICNNITQEKNTENVTKEFIVHLAHELMTPITTIKSYSEMLMDGEIEDIETQKEFYNTINGETDRLTRLIKDLLNISKIEMGILTLDKDLVKSEWLFEDCIAAVEGTAQKRSISIERNLPDSFPALIGDKEQLKASIINILGNAVKYTPEGGQIEFGIREQDKMVMFDVRDTGYGMSEDDLTHIFDKFYRSKDPQVVAQQGAGLGLAIAAEIVQLHDGEIEVQSELGKGTHFTIKIPKEEYTLG